MMTKKNDKFKVSHLCCCLHYQGQLIAVAFLNKEDNIRTEPLTVTTIMDSLHNNYKPQARLNYY